MSDPEKLGSIVGRVMTSHLEGKRVRLVKCTDPYTKLPPGLEGTVGLVDSTGTLHVDWDNGSYLGLVPGEDEWEVLP